MKTVSLRLDDGLRARFDEYAKRQRRSVNAQIAHLIEEALQEDAPFIDIEPFNIPCPTCKARAGNACAAPAGDRPAAVICAERIQAATRRGSRTGQPACTCGHPAEAHDASECWWDLDVDAESWNPVKQCGCDWYTPVVPRVPRHEEATR